jgi:multisubunit Na+/H+ antiporter MnhF subunit
VAAFVPFSFAVFWEVVVGTWEVTLVTLHLRPLKSPGIVEVPIGERTPTGVAVWAVVTGLTPGTFFVDVDRERGVVLIHVIDAGAPRRSVASSKISTAATREGCSREGRSEVSLHEVVFYLAFAWMTVLLVVGVAAVIRLRSTAGRILALDMTTLILVALLILYADANRSPYYLDAALVLSLLAFLATLALARYHGERRIF